LFKDLKVAFDSVDRRVLAESLSERGLREELVERVEERLKVLGEIKSSVRVGDKMGKGFWTGRGLRTGMFTTSNTIQFINSEYRGNNGEGEMRRDEVTAKESVFTSLCE